MNQSPDWSVSGPLARPTWGDDLGYLDDLDADPPRHVEPCRPASRGSVGDHAYYATVASADVTVIELPRDYYETKPRPDFRCSRCFEPGHPVSRCPLPEPLPPPEVVWCHRCGEEGHEWGACRKAEPEQAPQRPQRCGRCGRMGHNRLTCVMPERVRPEPLGRYRCGRCGGPGHNQRTCRVDRE